MKKIVITAIVAILMTMSLSAQETCPACNGSGISSAVVYHPPTFGLERSRMKESCPYCSVIAYYEKMISHSKRFYTLKR